MLVVNYWPQLQEQLTACSQQVGRRGKQRRQRPIPAVLGRSDSFVT
jgi:hypothetical protein